MNISKFQYISKTLSRTVRKDSENYVLNAIYNRIGDTRLVPVSQQYIFDGKKRYFIDLYFPQLNIGIECDELHHLKQTEADINREITIVDVLKSIKKDSSYEAFHIKVDDSHSFEDIEIQIDNTVNKIKAMIAVRDADGVPISWEDVFKDNRKDILLKGYINVRDDIVFPRIVDVDNDVFGKKSLNQQHAFYSISSTQMAWFPKLAVNGKSVARGWNNELTLDGQYIIEYNDKGLDTSKKAKHLDKERVTFARVNDPITGENNYRFVGIFKYDRPKSAGKTFYYKKISDQVLIVRHDE